MPNRLEFRNMAQSGSAHVWGTWGRGFESRYSDQFNGSLAH